IRRSAVDQRIGQAIEQLLCQGHTRIAGLPDAIKARLVRFVDAGLARVDGDRLTIADGGLPYARTIAAQFDPYRHAAEPRFSSAI
ncbi:hypothetical protein, partial [Enterococcus faecium]|uniref:hypothetical protein n=1 Tax=Enterococcus faecium TaxID=1352 RepID=UPI003F43B065